MTRYYINKKDIDKTLQKITEAQTKSRVFVNVSVKPYHGKKYDRENTVVITIG